VDFITSGEVPPQIDAQRRSAALDEQSIRAAVFHGYSPTGEYSILPLRRRCHPAPPPRWKANKADRVSADAGIFLTPKGQLLREMKPPARNPAQRARQQLCQAATERSPCKSLRQGW